MNQGDEPALAEDDEEIARIREARHRISERVGHDPYRLVAYYIERQKGASRQADPRPGSGGIRQDWNRLTVVPPHSHQLSFPNRCPPNPALARGLCLLPSMTVLRDEAAGMLGQHYLNSPQGRLAQYRSRLRRRLHLFLGVEPKSKHAMKLPEKLAIQNLIVKELQEQKRRAFRGTLAAQIDLSTAAPNPPHLYSAIKNLLDLFGSPIEKTTRRKAIVYYDDSQIRVISINYNIRTGTAGIRATFSPLRDFLADTSLAADILSGILPESHDLALEERSTWRHTEDAIDSYFSLKSEGLPVDSDLFGRLLLHQKRQAQEALLSRVTIRNLSNLYSESGTMGRKSLISHPTLTSAIAESNQWFRESPIRIHLPYPPRSGGDTKLFRASVDQALESFEHRWRHLCVPLLTPVALEVVFKPAPGSTEPARDLDNLMKIILSRFHERLKPPANYVQAMATDDKLEARYQERLPPKSLPYSVVRMDVFSLARTAGDRSSGFLVMGVAAEMTGVGGAWSRADEIIEQWQELYENRI